MTLMTRRLNQPLDEPADDECGEAEYRQGMSDGIGKVLLAVEPVPTHIDKTQLEEMGRWWHQLLRWSSVPLSQASEPPNIEWHEATEEGRECLYQRNRFLTPEPLLRRCVLMMLAASTLRKTHSLVGARECVPSPYRTGFLWT